ncbi:hypothetical protein [Streptomyces asiaticus]|uniref:hypothetical protein n=1 Tax=Streptomyces asiaticus TaxID=114695 RepID=UPI003F668619
MSTARNAATPILPEGNAWRIGYAEIATLAEVQRPVVTTWGRRHPDFPQPVAYEGGRPLFDGGAVVDWLLATDHGNADPRHLRAELSLHTLAGWRERMPARVLVGVLTSLICLRQQQDAPVSGSDWDALLERAAEFDPDDMFLLAELRAVPDAERVGPALTSLTDELIEAAYTPAEAFDWVLDARRRLGSHELAADAPTAVLARALAQLAGTADLGNGAVLAVPHARSGDLLAALHEATAPHTGRTYLAADPDPVFARLVRRRMLVRGVHEFQLDVAVGEEPSTDDWGDPDLVLCCLPYEAAETRNSLTVLEHVQALTDLLDEGRTAVVLGPADALVYPLPPRGDADRLRRSFLAGGLLKSAISLPDGAFPYRPAYRTAIWILHRTPEDQRRGFVMLADLSARPLTEQTLDALVEDVQIWRAAGWQADRRHEPRHAAIVPAIVLDQHPGTAFTLQHRPHTNRYTRPVMERPVRISELELQLVELNERARRETDLRAALRTHAVLRPAEAKVPRTTVARLLKERRLRRLPGHRIAPEHMTADGHYPVLTPAEVVGLAPVGSRRMDRAARFTVYDHAKFTEPGDIVVTAQPELGAYVDAEGLSVVAYPARVLRVRRDAERPVRPRVLAALLRAAATEHRRVDGAVRASRRIEDLLIPDLEPEEAERYDDFLAEVAGRVALLQAQTTALDDLVRLTAAGLTDGTLTITDPTH